MIDQYYTPPGLAAFLVGASKVRKAALVADFAMGDGALLRAAEARWPGTKLFGCDVCSDVENKEHGLKSTLSFTKLDFFDDHEKFAELAEIQQACDVILLNPPFSCRGNIRYPASLGKDFLYGSKALAFVCRALQYLKPKGEILAILPASCLTSERDKRLMDALRGEYLVDQIGEINRNAFPSCTVSVVVVRIKRSVKASKSANQKWIAPLVALKPFKAKVMRGIIPVHNTSTDQGEIPVIHTTDLRDLANFPRHWVGRSERQIQGDVVLLPRVGRPDKSKLIIAKATLAALSDCVIAIQTEPPGFEEDLFRLMRSRWSEIELLYGGSCALYLTLGKLRHFLQSAGVFCESDSRRLSAAPEDGKAAKLGQMTPRYAAKRV